MKRTTSDQRRKIIQFLLYLVLILSVPAYSFAQPNELCANATAISSSTTCSPISSTLVGAAYTTITSACGTSRPDVWFIFTAKSTNPTVTISGLSNARFQVYTAASCGGTVSSVICVNAASGTATPLVIGNQYLIRVYQNSGTATSFTICVVDPAPVNDNCSGAITLTSGTSCANTTGNIYAATNSAPTISAPDCAGTVAYDVWYKFIAQTTNPTISLGSVGSSFTNAGMQLLLPVTAGTPCGASGFTPLYCGATSISSDFLTVGTTYYIRVYSTGGLVPGAPTDAGFDICITDPVTTSVPFNDECTNAINLPIWNSCNNISGNMAGATASSTPLGSSCSGGTVAYDVWYKFTAINTTATITLSSFGANFTNQRIEMFSGTCGSLNSIFCSANPLSATGLTAGTTYYLRVYSTSGPSPNGNARFNICAQTSNAPVRFGNSYVNITKKKTGGVVEPGDTLEIRMTINHVSTSGTTTMYGLRYVDNIPTLTAMLTGVKDSIRIITNEGLTFRRYSLAAGDDAATYLAAPPAGQFNIRMNLGFGATFPAIPANNTSTESATATGQMAANTSAASTDKPKGGGGMLFATAYRVVVTGNAGDTISINPGEFIYKTTAGGSDITLTSTPYKILISEPRNLCSNSIGVNNAEEFGGTFGSGSTLNRSSDLTTPISGYSFISDVNAYNGVGDGRYAIVKNLSPRSSTVTNARRQNSCNGPTPLNVNDPSSCSNRMFTGFWFIDGDHSGTNNATGNAPPAAATTAGYMLMVNADYVASQVYQQNITNLCPNTYYEFSAWVRNICPNCGIDSAGTSTYLPGVYPNLTFSLNNVDYYSTGEVDTAGWSKKGFVFRTGAAQTSASFSIRNNSQGGGGNDWAMDDIAVTTCLPTMSYSPTIHPTICKNNPQTINDTISSYFDNYTTYKWQRSTNAGSSWVDITGVTTLPDTNYYITSYVIPVTHTTLANDGDKYRVVVATTASNLSNTNCNISDGVTISVSVIDCGVVLKSDLLSFSGRLMNKYGILSWTSSREDEPIHFELQSSNDNSLFTTIATINGNGGNRETNYYSFTDPLAISDNRWYRVIMVNDHGNKKYSHTIQLSNTGIDFDIENVINPFSDQLMFNIVSGKSSRVEVELMDLQGKNIKSTSFLVYAGVNSMRLTNTGQLASGIYTLRVSNNEKVISRKVVKSNR